MDDELALDRHVLEQLLAEYDAQLDSDDGNRTFNITSLELTSSLPEWQDARGCLDLIERVRRRADPLLATAETVDGRTDPPAETPADTSVTLGRFRIERLLGQGGLGIVYLAYDPHLQRQVALKVPRVETLASREARGRFLREAEAAARLNHAHVVTVHDSGEDDSICYITLEFCNGGDLAAWLRQHGPAVPPDDAATVVAELADAVDHAHSQGVLHRDIKPSNVLLSLLAHDRREISSPENLRRYTVKLSDFGLARILETDSGIDATRTGAVLGTTQYMAPEQAEGRTREISPATDVYALGTLLYQLLTGRPAFEGVNERDILTRLLVTEPTPPRRINRAISPDLEAICRRCLQKQPADRYDTASRLADDLRRYLNGQETLARPLTAMQRAWNAVFRRPLVSGLASALLLTLIAIVVVTWIYNSRLVETVAKLRVQREVALARELEAREYAYGADMMLAQQAWDRSAAQEARELLERHVPVDGQTDLRRFEWYSLNRRFGDRSTLIGRQPSKVWSMAVSPDGRLIATGDPEGVIRIFDRRTTHLLRELRGHEATFIDRLLFLADGKHLVSASDDHTIRWWEVETGKNSLIWDEHSDWVGALELSSDGKWLASGDGTGRVVLWNLEKRRKEKELYRHSGAVRWIVFSPQHAWVISACEAGEVRVWDYIMNREPGNFGDGFLPMPAERIEPKWHNAVFCKDGSHLYAGDGPVIYDWHMKHGMSNELRLTVYDAMVDKVMCVAYHPHSDLIIEGGDNRQDVIARKRTEPETLHDVLRAHGDAVRCLTPVPSEPVMLSGSEDGTVRQWCPTENDPEGVRLRLPDKIADLAWSIDGRQLWIATKDDSLHTIETERISLVKAGSCPEDVRWIFPLPRSDELLIVDKQGSLHRRGATGHLPVPLHLPNDASGAVLNSTRDRVAFSSGKTLTLCDLNTGFEEWTQTLPADLSRIICDSNESFVAACGDGSVYRLSAKDGTILANSLAHRNVVNALSVSADNSIIVSASHDNTVRLIETNRFQELCRFPQPEMPRHAFLIDGDQRLLVVLKRHIAILHVRTGQEVLNIPDAGGFVALNADRSWLAYSSGEFIRLLRLTEESPSLSVTHRPGL